MRKPGRPPHEEIGAECIAVRVRTLARAVTRAYDEALRPLGLTVGQLNLLVGIRRMEPEASSARLSELLEIDASTLSRGLALLERRGWIEGLRPEEGGRRRLWCVTAEGRALLRRARRPWRRAQREGRQLLERYGVERPELPVLRAGARSLAARKG